MLSIKDYVAGDTIFFNGDVWLIVETPDNDVCITAILYTSIAHKTAACFFLEIEGYEWVNIGQCGYITQDESFQALKGIDVIHTLEACANLLKIDVENHFIHAVRTISANDFDYDTKIWLY